MSEIVTRFAPSPTGYLHIGGARTALFNWLFTRHYGGKFLLRIEDTDRARSTDAAVKAIFNGLNWLGIEFDGEPIFQFARMNRHAEIAHELVEKGHAYYCYTSPEELDELRKENTDHQQINHILRARAQEASSGRSNRKHVIRIKAPVSGSDVVKQKRRNLPSLEKLSQEIPSPEAFKRSIESYLAFGVEILATDENGFEVACQNRREFIILRQPLRTSIECIHNLIYPSIEPGSSADQAMLIEDQVQGNVMIPYTQLDDMVMLRSDGTPTYMLSVVVDDHDMGITHVIRGDDHLTNAFRQRMIYDAMDWNVPSFSHIPLIHGPDGAKLSKRHGALAVEAYAEMGYLPEAMRNYLLRLGWGHGDTEIITSEDAMKIFELSDIGRSPSRMDFAKLANVNAHYMKQCPDDRLMTLLLPFLEAELGSKPDELGLARLKRGLHDLKDRAQTLIELARAGLFYLRHRPLPLNDDAAKVLDQPTRQLIGEMKQVLDTVSDFSHAQIETALKEFSAKKDLKLGKVAMPLRAAITGTTNSPSVFHVAEILGKEETLARLSDVA